MGPASYYNPDVMQAVHLEQLMDASRELSAVMTAAMNPDNTAVVLPTEITPASMLGFYQEYSLSVVPDVESTLAAAI